MNVTPLIRRGSPLVVTLLVLAACTNVVTEQRDAPELEALAAGTTESRVSASSDDVEEAEDGEIYATSPDLDIVYDRNAEDRGNQNIGLRFTNIGVPAGAEITEAYIEFAADETSSDATKVSFRGILKSDPATFSEENGSLSANSFTDERIIWEPGAWTSVGAKERTDDLSNVVQELVDLSGWESGNAMAFVISGPRGDRVADSYDGEPANAPLLHIKYAGEGGDSPEPSVSTCLTSSDPEEPEGTEGLDIEGYDPDTQVKLEGTIDGNEYTALKIKNNGDGLCVSGGTLVTDAEDDSSWRDVYHSAHNFVSLRNSQNVTVEQVAGEIAGDALVILARSSVIDEDEHAEGWTLSHAYFQHLGDDIVDNDIRSTGTIDNVLVDRAYMGISCRAYARGFQRDPGTMTVKNTLFAIKPQAFGYAPKDEPEARDTYANPFKWDEKGQLEEENVPVEACTLNLNNVTIYMAPHPTKESGANPVFSSKGIDPAEYVGECKEVTLLYGGEEYPYKQQLADLREDGGFDSSCFEVIEGSEARSEWNERRDDWFDRHDGPGFEHIQDYRDEQPLEP